MNYHKAQLLQMISQNSLEENYIKDTPGDDRTMKIIQAIANLIDKNIEGTFDVPSYNIDGRVPILELK